MASRPLPLNSQAFIPKGPYFLSLPSRLLYPLGIEKKGLRGEQTRQVQYSPKNKQKKGKGGQNSFSEEKAIFSSKAGLESLEISVNVN